MTDNSVTATAEQISQARQTLNHSVNPYETHQASNMMMNQALYYQNMNNQLQFMNQQNPFNQNHIQYIQNHMANPQANFLYQANQQGFLNINQGSNSIPLNNQQVQLNIPTPLKASNQAFNSPKAPNKNANQFMKNKTYNAIYSTPDELLKDRTEMFKKSKNDCDTPNKRFGNMGTHNFFSVKNN